MKNLRLEKALIKAFGLTSLQNASPVCFGNEYHYFYIIIEKELDNFYCGIHTSLKVNDGYMGSGTLIRRKIAVHGPEKFEKIILKFFSSREEAELFERQVISSEFLDRFKQNCYNLVEGGGGLRKGVSWMQKDGQHYRISKVLVPEYLKRGFVEEGTTHNRVGLHKDGKSIMVQKSEVQGFLENGWELGHNHTTTKGMKVLLDPKTGESRMYRLSEIPKKLEEGWILGQSEEVKKRYSASKQGRVRITNGKDTKNVRKEDLEKYLNEGWKEGSNLLNTKGKVYVNKDGKHKMVRKDDVQAFLQDGWNLGDIRKPRGRGKKVWMNNSQESRIIPVESINSWKEKGWELGMIRKGKS